MSAGPAPYLLNNTIMDNQAFNGSAVAGLGRGALLVNNILTGPSTSSAVWCSATAAPATVFSHNDVYHGGPSPYAGCAVATGTNGNISAQPPASDAGWRPTSPDNPMVDAGTNSATSLPALDLMERPRVTDGDRDGVATVDIGALELPGVRRPDRRPLPCLDARPAPRHPTGRRRAGGEAGPPVVVGSPGHRPGGVPDGASAVVFNVAPRTATSRHGRPGRPSRTRRASTSMPAGPCRTWSWSRSAPAGGRVNLFTSAASTDIVVDVEGWFGADGAPGGSRFTSLVPARVLDTRTGQHGYHWMPPARLQADGTVQLGLAGVEGILKIGVSAVVLNVTVTGPASQGWLTIWPSKGRDPWRSTSTTSPARRSPTWRWSPPTTAGSASTAAAGRSMSSPTSPAGTARPSPAPAQLTAVATRGVPMCRPSARWAAKRCKGDAAVAASFRRKAPVPVVDGH